MQRLNLPRLWRRGGGSRSALLIATVAVLVVGALGTGTVLVTRALAHTAPSARHHSPNPGHPSIKAEGAWFQQSHIGKSHPAPNARALAYQQAAQLPHSLLGVTRGPNGANLGTAGGTWVPLGPQPMDSSTCPSYCNNYGLNSGRITAEAVNPSNTNEIWVGAADGGLWHSTDGGAHWASVTDGQPTLSIGSIAVDPAHPTTIYVGTGEANLNGDAYWGDGILKSTNDGASWSLLASNLFGGLGIAKIAVDPHNSNNVAVATAYDGFTATNGAFIPWLNLGVWISSDAGGHWTETLYNHGNSAKDIDSGTDLVFDPAHPGALYAGLGNSYGFFDVGTYKSEAGVWYSANSGQTWSTHFTTGIPGGAPVQRVSLGISSDGTHVYAALTDSGTSGGVFGGLLNSAIYGTANSGGTWQKMDISGVTGMANDDGENQWWYDSYIAVDPTDANTVYVGGVDVWQTTAGVSSTSSNWTNLTNVYGTTPAGPHPDEHALAFLGNTSNYIIGNDGGVWSGTKAGAWTNRNSGGLNITQFYGGSIGEVGGAAQLYGGAQDNGEIAYPVGSVSTGGAVGWNESYGGDGGNTAVDYYDNHTVYEEYTYGHINKTTDGGMTWNPATNGINLCRVGCDAVNFIAPFAHSQVNDPVLVMGTDKVYLTSDGAASWTPLSPVLDGSPISAVAVTSDTTLYPYDGVYAGTNNGHIYGLTRAPGIWQTDPNFFCRVSQVTSIAVDYFNSSVAYATCAGFANGSGQHVFKTTDAALHWTDISGSLPNIPFESVALDPASNAIVAGSDAGVFVSQDGGSHWALLGGGLPNASVNQVFFDKTGGALFVATHGRGMWELLLPLFSSSVPAVSAATTTPGTSPAAQSFSLQNTGLTTLNWSTNSLPSWVSISPTSGTVNPGASTPITVTFNIPTTDPAKTYTTNLVFSDPHASNSGYTVPITDVAAGVSTSWYFAEGYTGGSFLTIFTLANPNPFSSAHVHIVYNRDQGGSQVIKDYLLNPNSRYSVNVDNDIGHGWGVATTITSDVPIVAERPIYYNYSLNGTSTRTGDDVVGATSLASSFDFAYLDTRGNHRTLLTFLNPTASTMYANMTFYPAAGGTAVTEQYSIPANARGAIDMAANYPSLANGLFSGKVLLTSDAGGTTPVNGLVERPLYATNSSTGSQYADDVIGVPTPGTQWYFAEGFTGGGGSRGQFNESLKLAYPAASGPTANISVTIYKEGVSTPVVINRTLAAGHVLEENINTDLPGWKIGNSIKVTSDQPILAERVLTWNQGATDAIGSPAPGNLQYFAEGYTGGGFQEIITLQNPQTTTAYVTVTFLPENGSAPKVVIFTVAPQSRFSFLVNTYAPSPGLSLIVESNVPILAERPMYWSSGGTDVIGYQPPGSFGS